MIDQQRKLLRMLAMFCLTLGLAGIQLSRAVPTFAATDNVTTCAGSGSGSLSAIVAGASSGDRITFSLDCSGSSQIPITSPLLIGITLTIDGTGHKIVLDGGNASDLFFVRSTGNFTLNNLTLQDGNFIGHDGGAITNSGTLTITDSTFTNNVASGGGAIDNLGTAVITGSTFANNSPGYGLGSVIANFGTLTITTSTLAKNGTAGGGGAIGNEGTASVRASIIANNTGGNCDNISGTINDLGYNLESGTDCGFTGSGSLQNTDPQLGSLADNGGPTQTMALQSTSPAIDQIPATNPLCSSPATDQRGVPRPMGTKCDIGAYEYAGGNGAFDAGCPDEATLQTDLSTGTLSNGGAFFFTCATDTTITFSSTITVGNELALVGNAGPGKVTLDGGNAVQLFSVNSGVALGLNDLTLQHGKVISAGGGAILNNGTLTITNSTLANNSSSNNSISSSHGGAIDNNYGTLTITSSTLTNNSGTLGGAIYIYGGSVAITDSTLANNSVGVGYGGAIDNLGALTITSSTLTNNSGAIGAAIFNAVTASIGASIIADNTGGNCSGNIMTDEGYNLDTDGSCLNGGTGDISGKGPQLGSLANNGGPTQTIALQAGSPALDRIPTSYDLPGTTTPLCSSTDQRGYLRPDDGEASCDIGAYEHSGPDQPPTTLSAVSGSGPYGGTATLTATLTAAGSGLSGKTVSFTLNGSTVCGGATGVTCPITDGSGVATLQNVSLAGINAGSYSTAVDATFAGDASSTGSSAGGALTVATAAQTITVTTHAPVSAPYNGSFTVAATASSGLAVTYSSSGSCSNSGATFTITSSSGPCTVAYDQAGNGNYDPAAEVTETVNAQKADQTITFGTLPNHTYGDADFPVSATASSGLAVSFSAAGSCTLVSGSTVHITGAGSCTITASQGGDSNYNAATSVSQTFTIARASATIALNQSSLSATYDGNPHLATATTAPSGLSYSVSYTDSNNNPVTNPTNAGSYAVTATITDPNYQGSTTGTLAIAQASQTISFSPLANHTYGDQPFTVSATASSGLPVSFSVGSTDQCTIAGNTVTITGAGSCTVTAGQSGNGNYTAATNVSQTFSIAKAASTTSVTSSATTSVFGQAVTFTAKVSPPAATGTVQFQIDGATSGLPVPLTGGSATLTTSALAVGSHTVSAVYSGDSSFIGSTAAGLTQTINQAATTTSLVSSATPSLLKQGVTFTATVAAVAPGSGTPGGTVTFMDGTTTLGTTTLNGSGIATFTTTALTAGTHSITASYAGNASFTGSTSSAVSQQVRYTVKVLSTSGLTIVLQLLDANGANVSASNLTVTAECVVPYSATAPTTCGPSPVQTISKAFGFVTNYKGLGAAYSYSVNPHGLTKGQQYDLLVQADGDPIWHAVPFTA